MFTFISPNTLSTSHVMNNNNSLPSQQYYSQEVSELSMDNSQQQHVPSPQSQQLDSANFANQLIKIEHESQSGDNTSAVTKETDTKKKRAGPKRRKVTHEFNCDPKQGRPCQRCIKRSIGHLCHDEPKGSHGPQQIGGGNNAVPANLITMQSVPQVLRTTNNYPNFQDFSQLTYTPLPTPLTFASEHTGHEFTVLTNFLESVDGSQQSHHNNDGLTADTTDKFFLTAADPSDGTSEDRLTQVINAKFEAGFLKPYNYVNGYYRLSQYMDNHMSNLSRQRILSSLSIFRPSFRNVAQTLTDVDLVMVEGVFERLLLDYDRVFSSMGIPACLWRRTGEIYKGNKEFASLVGVPVEMLREGRLCIYELMMEESAVNYWEKYGNIAFDAGQKAVLTSCLLKGPDQDPQNVTSYRYVIVVFWSAIIGNFLPIRLAA
ncbi:21459_t:CDS:10 [Dentiscutata erythropus]|uniref:21459_t:CDS:1 n=1 Tax=Dentiscutata erythropus TaxID=1348616 RepID=A0A9N9BPX3_9GLOM|nr:21459_t:CDS:10 [Dentiscutata erythropus]